MGVFLQSARNTDLKSSDHAAIPDSPPAKTQVNVILTASQTQFLKNLHRPSANIGPSGIEDTPMIWRPFREVNQQRISDGTEFNVEPAV